MRIYIDESGNFVIPGTPPVSFSVVLALVVPSTIEAELFYEFLRLRDAWPIRGVEIKGSSLNESQAAQLIDLLTRFDVFVEFFALDLVSHSQEGIDDFKNRQADEIVAHLTAEHSAGVTDHLNKLSKSVREMPNQLFVQSVLTLDLIFATVQNALLYYVQRLPIELGDIAWIVDRKNRTITEMEETWSTLILPIGESHFAKRPMIVFMEADYSHFDRRYRAEPDDEMNRHLEWVRKAYNIPDRFRGKPVTDAKKLMTEQLQFADSRDLLGLQLADMLASILRRSLNDKLQYEGWEDFGKLLIQKRKDETPFVLLGKGGDPILTGRPSKVAKVLFAKAKPMVKKEP